MDVKLIRNRQYHWAVDESRCHSVRNDAISVQRLAKSMRIDAKLMRSRANGFSEPHESIRLDSSPFVSIRFALFRMILFALTSYRFRIGFASTSPRMVSIRIGTDRSESIPRRYRLVSSLLCTVITSSRIDFVSMIDS